MVNVCMLFNRALTRKTYVIRHTYTELGLPKEQTSLCCTESGCET